MTEADGFVVQGNKKAWRRHALRAILVAIAATYVFSTIPIHCLTHPHEPMPNNSVIGLIIFMAFFEWTILEITMAALLAWTTAGRAPLIDVSPEGVLMRTPGYRPRRLGWDEIRSIHPTNTFSFRLFDWQAISSIVLIPHRPASLYSHLTAWERLWAFGSTHPNVPQRLGRVAVSGLVMEIPPEEFIRKLNDYYLKYAMQPELPGWPYPSKLCPIPEPRLRLCASAHHVLPPNVEQSRNVLLPPRVLISGTTQRRALHRPARPLQAGIRRRMPKQRGVERMSAMLNQETETQAEPKIASLAPETDSRVTPQELTAAIEAIERRKAEAQRRLAETIPVDQAVRELGIDATPEEVIAEVRAQRAARAGAPSAASNPATPAAPQPSPAKQSFETFIRQFVRESGIDALPDEIIAQLRARRLAREKGIAVDQIASHHTRPTRGRRWRGAGVGIGMFFLFAWLTGGWQHAPFATSDHDTDTAKAISRTLAEIPANHPFTSDTASLQEIAEGKPANTITVIDNEDMDDNHDWTVFKKSGHCYIKAYLPARLSQEALRTAPIKIYNDHSDTPGNDEVKVTVQIDGTKVVASSEDGEDSTITLSNVQPNEVTYDWDN